jgi:hypothetical protein
MAKKRTPGHRVVALPLTPVWALRRIRALATRSENVRFTVHALERMEEREIFDGDVLRILRSMDSSIKGGVERAKNNGEIKCKVVRQIRGLREAGTIVVVLPNDTLLVLTVEWEDLS